MDKAGAAVVRRRPLVEELPRWPWLCPCVAPSSIHSPHARYAAAAACALALCSSSWMQASNDELTIFLSLPSSPTPAHTLLSPSPAAPPNTPITRARAWQALHLQSAHS